MKSKAAYKRAMKYHRTVTGDKEAEAKFKEIKEAYEVLTDSQKTCGIRSVWSCCV